MLNDDSHQTKEQATTKNLDGYLYLISILLLFIGLNLFQTGSDQNGLLETVVMYLLQIGYEALMFIMALKLLTRQKQHAYLLLGLGLLLSADVTFFQYHISSASLLQNSPWIAYLTIVVYLGWTVIKIGLFCKQTEMELSPILWLPYLSSLLFLHVTPLLLMQYNSWFSHLLSPQHAFAFSWELWVIWLIACLLMLPTCLGLVEKAVRYCNFDYALQIARIIPCFMWILIPLHLLCCTHVDAILASNFGDTGYVLIPYLILSVFLYKRYLVWKFDHQLQEQIAELAPAIVLQVINWNCAPNPNFFGNLYLDPIQFNMFVIYGYIGYLALKRSNPLATTYLLVSFTWFFRQIPTKFFSVSADFISSLSKKAWSVLLVCMSFVSLIIGFHRSKKRSPEL